MNFKQPRFSLGGALHALCHPLFPSSSTATYHASAIIFSPDGSANVSGSLAGFNPLVVSVGTGPTTFSAMLATKLAAIVMIPDYYLFVWVGRRGSCFLLSCAKKE